jgi:hypothetical protein
MIKLYKERYEVEDTGKVWCLDYYGVPNNRKELPHSTKTRYIQVGINGSPEDIHRILAILFIPNPDNLPMVNHKDGNKHNYSLDNLEWVTGKQNSEHAIATGLEVKQSGGRVDRRSKVIHQIDKVSGNVVGIYYGTREASKEAGIDRRWLQRILSGKEFSTQGGKYKTTLTEAKGCYWRWVEL